MSFSDSNSGRVLLLMPLDVRIPVPMLTMQPMPLEGGQMRLASSNNALIGLLYPRPPSTYAVEGLPIDIGGKNVGAAEVARQACHIGQSSMSFQELS